MKAALLGLLQSGKSTILSAISGKTPAHASATVIEEAIVPVPDERIDWLSQIYKPQKKVYATIDCLDVPGLAFTDDHARANAKRFFGQLRTVDLLVFVIRAFSDPTIPPYRNSVNPARDLEEMKRIGLGGYATLRLPRKGS